MAPSPSERKRPRSYDASRRRARASERRGVLLDTARTLFLRDGYSATTVESIADAAGLSAATIYKTHGGKSGLVRSLCERALAGGEDTPAEERSNALRTHADPRTVIEGWGRLVAEVTPRIAPLLLLLGAAAERDPEAAALLAELDRSRLSRMTDNANHLARARQLRTGVTAYEARDVLWLSTCPELYDLLVNRRAWDVAAYSRFVTNMMTSALL